MFRVIIVCACLHSCATCFRPAAGTSSGAAGGGGPVRTLQEVLECGRVTKLLYDVRCDAEALYHQHGVRLGGAVDLQLAEVGRGEEGKKMGEDGGLHGRVQRKSPITRGEEGALAGMRAGTGFRRRGMPS